MRLRTRLWLAGLVAALLALVLGAGLLFSWMVHETHFDRSSPELDGFAAAVSELPGVSEVQHERWVEAPLFVDPVSWIGLDVEQEHLPGLLDELCTAAHPEAVSWSISVAGASGGTMSLHSQTDSSGRAMSGGACPSFGFDAVPLVDELDSVAPGLPVQPAIWENGRFALVALEEVPDGYTRLLPLVEHSAQLLDAAGLDADRTVEINSTTLGATILPGQQDPYLALLTRLAEDHGASAFWADGGGAPNGEDERVNVTAPAERHEAIRDAISASDLHIAGLPVTFHEP